MTLVLSPFAQPSLNDASIPPGSDRGDSLWSLDASE